MPYRPNQSSGLPAKCAMPQEMLGLENARADENQKASVIARIFRLRQGISPDF
jgi:hypothetical protein